MNTFSPGRHSVKHIVRTLALLLLVGGLALPVRAQGQTPDSPRPRPGVGLGAGQGQLDPDLSEDRERQSLRERREDAGERLRDRGDSPAAEPAAPVEHQGDRPPAEPGQTVVRGGVVARPGQPGAAAPLPATPGRVQQSSGASVTVAGSQTPFEPLFERKLDFPELPDEGELVSMEGPMDLVEFLQTINMSTNWNVVLSKEVEETALGFFVLNLVPPREAIQLLQHYDLYYRFDEDKHTLYVMPVREMLQKEFGELNSHEFAVRHADIPYVESVLATVVSPAGRIITDQRTGRIYVWDTQDNLDLMVKMVRDLDVPLQRREFSIQYAELADIQTALEALRSPNGRLLADARTEQIFAWDSPAALEQMSLAVDRLDVPVETRTVSVKHIAAENLVDSMVPLLSERGILQVDPRTNTLVITDLPARVDRMASLIDTLDMQMETRSWRIAHADPEFVAAEIEALIPEQMGRITLNDQLNQITVSGLPGRLDEIEALIREWDHPRPQVHIQAFIVEVGSEVEREFNINWSYFGNAGSSPFVIHSGDGAGELVEAPGDGQAMSIGQLPYAIPLYGALELDGNTIRRPILTNIDGETVIDRFAGNNLAVALNYLDQQNKATILSKPSITVQNGEEAIFENATRVPYVSSTTLFGGQFTGNPLNSINNTNRIDFIDVGTILSVLPRISQEGSINLEIDAEDSTFVMRSILANGQVSTIPEKTLRRAQTELRMNSGDTVVLGGLRRDRAANSVTRTPLLGDLPIVGRLFRNPSKASRNNTLMIFITTTVLEDGTHPEAKLLADAEAEIAGKMRHNTKNLWGRLADKATGGRNELGVSIGETGEMYSEGQFVTLDELREAFQTAPVGVRIIIRRHPRSPDSLVGAVTEAALENNLRIEFDNDIAPIVPSYSSVVIPMTQHPQEAAQIPELKEASPALTP